ncbi:hypothetical protein B4U79_18930 [Dinothrombium tinctorium]|uniref:Uncharacterized protein n=1 Tax=Dinothrombium tinctorium TaxID=1965070 RepID=A0A3S3PWR1_9ACAR|nr:hypothetical protein B4U79_18930 [Dinothrombium tinctorium]
MQTHEIILMLYVIIIPILFVITLLHINQVEKGFEKGFRQSLQEYNNDRQQRAIIDELQIEYECCGARNYEDWFKANHSSSAVYSEAKVPFSCCLINYIAAVFWLLDWFVVIFALIIHRYFYTSIKNAVINTEDANTTAYGWILASSPLARFETQVETKPIVVSKKETKIKKSHEKVTIGNGAKKIERQKLIDVKKEERKIEIDSKEKRKDKLKSKERLVGKIERRKKAEPIVPKEQEKEYAKQPPPLPSQPLAEAQPPSYPPQYTEATIPKVMPTDVESTLKSESELESDEMRSVKKEAKQEDIEVRQKEIR